MHLLLYYVVTLLLVPSVTTDTAHIEIKRWMNYTQCIGQLIAYNVQCPRDELHAYMFDKTCGERKIKSAIETMRKAIEGVKLYTFEHVGRSVCILDMQTDTVVFKCEIDSS